jgi:predicted component of type VI protein secretion system
MLAKLISLDGGNSIPLKKDVTVVGRSRGVCDVYLDRHSVSKLHCVIVKTDGLLFVRDLGSTNGTKVNGERIIRGALLPGDELAFAKARYRVHLGPDNPREQAPPTEMLTSFPPRQLEAGHPGNGHGNVDSESDVRLLSDDSF